MPTSFSKWGVDILVAFKPDSEVESIATTHMNHSTGEKATAAAMYLMAVQRLSGIPFWFVDEINSGLSDPQGEEEFSTKREELFFNQILSRSVGAQFFYITPRCIPPIHRDNCKVPKQFHVFTSQLDQDVETSQSPHATIIS